MTEVEILRQRVLVLQNTIQDMQTILNKTVSTSVVTAVVATIEQRLNNLEDRIDSIETRLAVLEEDG